MTTKYFDRGDYVLEITEHSPTERTKRMLPKPHTKGLGGVSAPVAPKQQPAPEPRRIENRRKRGVVFGATIRHEERLGDKLANALEAVGVTKDRWTAAKASLGLPATCNCPARQVWLNNLDESLGLGEKLGAFKALLKW
jgi:hypothetical protein